MHGSGTENKGASNVAVRLKAVGRDGVFAGMGEFPLRGRSFGPSPSIAWRFVRSALKDLQGAQVSSRPKAALDQVQARVADMRQQAENLAKSDSDSVPGAVVAGFETALMDLAARVTGTTVAELLGGAHGQVGESLVRVRYDHTGLRPSLDRISDARVIRVLGLGNLGDAEAALAAMSQSSDSLHAVWLDFDDRLDQDAAKELISILAQRIDAADLPAHVVVDQPLATQDLAALAMLQATADASVPPAKDRPGVVIVGGASAPADAKALANAGVRGLELNVFTMGGASRVSDAVRLAKGVQPGVRLCLSADPQMSTIGRDALIELDGGLQRLDYLDLPDGNNRSAANAGGGTSENITRLGQEFSFAPLVGRLKRYIEVPSRSSQPSLKKHGLPANDFDLATVKGFATYAWGIPLTSHLVERAALARGMNTTRLWSSVFLARHPDLMKPVGFGMRRSGWTAVSARHVADDKELSRHVLRKAGVSVPRGEAFEAHDVDAAVKFASSLDRPATVKPRAGSHGIGVALDLRSEHEVRRAISALSETAYRGRDFIVEEYVEGNYYRFLVVGDRVVSVVLCEPASVAGDGESTIIDLVIAKNQMRLRNPHGHTRLIDLGADAQLWLDRQGSTVQSVPGRGEVVRIGSAGNVASGGDSIDVLDETHPSMIDFAVRATQAVPGLDHCGVDLIGDHTLPADQQHASIIEINSAPGTVLNHYPLFGPARDVSSELLLRSCKLAGFEPTEVRDHIAVRLEVFGVVQRVGYRAWFAQLAHARGLVGSIRNTSTDSVEAYVSGPTEHVAAMVSRAYIGPRNAAVSRVEATQVDAVPGDGFEVADDD